MSYSRGQYYEQSSRSRSRDRKYRREYRDDGYRYSSSYGGGGGGGSEYAGGRSGGGSYGAGRRSSRPSHAVESQSHHHGGGGGSEYDESKFVLAVFNLSIYTTESELYDVFSKFGPLKKATVVIDAKSFWQLSQKGIILPAKKSEEDGQLVEKQTVARRKSRNQNVEILKMASLKIGKFLEKFKKIPTKMMEKREDPKMHRKRVKWEDMRLLL